MSSVVKEIRPDHVAIYIRWSTEDQGDGTTLVVQQEGCQHYVLSQGWRVTPSLIFIDDGHSGGTLDRPKMRELRQAVKNGRVDCVVVYKLDRLSRSVMDTVNLVLDEWEGRTYLKSAREPIDTSTPMGKQIFYLLVSYAEWERNVIKERTFSGKLRRAKEGKNPGIPAAFGYRRGAEAGTFEIEPDKAELVRWMFRKYLEEYGTYKMADELNRTGIPSPKGLQWHKTSILQILKNPVYAGRLVYARTTTNPRRQRDKSEPTYLRNPEPVVAEGQFPAIIDLDQWERVQTLMKKRHRTQTGVRSLSSEHLLTGVLKCRCGGTMHSHCTVKNGKEYYYYECLTKAHKGPTACNCGHMTQRVVDSVVESELATLLQSEEAYQSFLNAQKRGVAERIKEVQDHRRQAAVALEQFEGQMRTINRDYRSGKLSVDAYEENRREIEKDRAQTREQLADLERLERVLAEQMREQGSLHEIIDLARRWEELDIPKRKVVLRNLVNQVVAYKSRETGEVSVHVDWKFAQPPEAAAQ